MDQVKIYCKFTDCRTNIPNIFRDILEIVSSVASFSRFPST